MSSFFVQFLRLVFIMVLLFTLVKLLIYFFVLISLIIYLDVFSRRYIKSLELLHDCDENEANDSVARPSITSCSLRKSSQIAMNNSENSHEIDHKKFS